MKILNVWSMVHTHILMKLYGFVIKSQRRLYLTLHAVTLYQQAQRLFGTPVDVTRGAATYKENVNSARYMKQSVENVVLFMDYTI